MIETNHPYRSIIFACICRRHTAKLTITKFISKEFKITLAIFFTQAWRIRNMTIINCKRHLLYHVEGYYVCHLRTHTSLIIITTYYFSEIFIWLFSFYLFQRHSAGDLQTTFKCSNFSLFRQPRRNTELVLFVILNHE